MSELDNESVNLVVTSPPYPMIRMWDESFGSLSPDVSAALDDEDGSGAWEEMHRVLDRIWAECFRVLKPGGFACINIGDATRKLGDDFRLYPNHARITSVMAGLGFSCLPVIHWFKPTNAPNKFMGSGMLPAGAYVTLEHEYILVFRKGRRRVFSDDESVSRRRSAYFWEERNRWFSDVWDFRGINQPVRSVPDDNGRVMRERSGAYPFELPHRLINMYSIQGDTVLDPFLGTGTTLAAAIVNGRSCIGFETEAMLADGILRKAEEAAGSANILNERRLDEHRSFIRERSEKKGSPEYKNNCYNFPVITRQEVELRLPLLADYSFSGGFTVLYE